ncbi:MAG: histidine kinase [Thermoanaerobacteraceae bacterium]|nr:histidine kinase [Thermoanaerobacteraceae bacterium]
MQKRLALGVIARWLPINLLATGLVLLWDPAAWMLVVAMLCVNAVAAFLVNDYLQKQRLVNLKAEKHPLDSTLQIASQTLPYLRRGLNEQTAEKTAEIIQRISDVSAVAITDRHKVLAYIGAGADHHRPGRPIMTDATREVLSTGQLKVVINGYDLHCPVPACPLQSAVIAPLKCKEEVVGTIKLYRTQPGEVPVALIKLAVGVAQLLGMQMELAELDRQAQLVTEAELDALHAQINPHFLFNTLNTIIMFSRTNPETARRLLIRLSCFFRHALKRHGHFNTLKEEIEYLNTYLILEKARFRDKLRIVRNIDRELLDYRVPVLTIQPLVENAIKHGILPKPGQGTVQITAQRLDEDMLIVIRDDGVGIAPERLPEILRPGVGSGNGVGLSNVHERLKGLFGEDYGLRIISAVNAGTSVYVRVPLMCKLIKEEGRAYETQSVNR